MVCIPPQPGRGFRLSVALCWESALSPWKRSPSREPGPGRGQVRRRAHPGLVDVQGCTFRGELLESANGRG